MSTEMSVDMQRGVYRKVYSGFIWGDRINSVSMEAEAWFWRLNAIADDFGNLPGDGYRVAVEAGGNRRITPKRAEDLTKELVDAGLVSRYADGKYIHVVGFEERQPAGRNGRKIQKYPTHPPESDLCPNGSTTGDPGESGGIQNRPGDSCPPMPMPMPMPMPKTKPTAGDLTVVIPPELDTPDFRVAWKDYLDYRTEQRYKPLKPRSIIALYSDFQKWGVNSAIESIRETIKRGWQGVFEPKGLLIPNGGPQAAPRTADKYAEHRAPAARWFLSLSPDEQVEAASGTPDLALSMAAKGTVPNDVLFAYRDATKGVGA